MQSLAGVSRHAGVLAVALDEGYLGDEGEHDLCVLHLSDKHVAVLLWLPELFLRLLSLLLAHHGQLVRVLQLRRDRNNGVSACWNLSRRGDTLKVARRSVGFLFVRVVLGSVDDVGLLQETKVDFYLAGPSIFKGNSEFLVRLSLLDGDGDDLLVKVLDMHLL